MDNIFFLITIAVYGLAFYNVIRIVLEDHNPPTALAWIVVNLAVPYIGVPLYYLVGENKLRKYLRKREISQTELEQIERLSHNAAMEPPPALHVDPEVFRLFSGLFDRYDAMLRPFPCDLKLLIDGEATFEDIFATIKAAKRYIFVQYYIIRSDRLGLELRNLLLQKARQGVAVYFLIDDIGSFWLTRSYLKGLRKGGVNVAKFLPLRLPFNLQVNFRNHRKLVLVDGETAHIGGLNVGIEYIGKRKQGYWRDTHVRVTGPCVWALQQVFLNDWYFAAKRSIKLEPLQLTEGMPHPHDSGCNSCAQVIPFGPSDKIERGVLLFMQVIQAARRKLWIASPYFIPDTSLERLLELAALRGIDVRVLIPSRPDHLFVHRVTVTYARRLLSKGIKVYLYTKGFMHQKVIQVDDALTVMGTSNFDNRSMYLNFETALLVHDQVFGKEVSDMLSKDFIDARLLQPTGPQAWWQGFPSKLVRLLAPLL